MGQSPSRETEGCFADQGISHSFWKPKCPYRVYKIPYPDSLNDTCFSVHYNVRAQFCIVFSSHDVCCVSRLTFVIESRSNIRRRLQIMNVFTLLLFPFS